MEKQLLSFWTCVNHKSHYLRGWFISGLTINCQSGGKLIHTSIMIVSSATTCAVPSSVCYLCQNVRLPSHESGLIWSLITSHWIVTRHDFSSDTFSAGLIKLEIQSQIHSIIGLQIKKFISNERSHIWDTSKLSKNARR